MQAKFTPLSSFNPSILTHSQVFSKSSTTMKAFFVAFSALSTMLVAVQASADCKAHWPDVSAFFSGQESLWECQDLRQSRE